MSRLGKNPVAVPSGVTVEIKGSNLKAKGSKGELSMDLHREISAKQDGDNIVVAPTTGTRTAKAMWATTRTLINNVVVGVSEGYTKDLLIKGIGYRAQLKGKILVLQLGFSHEVNYEIPEGITIAVEKNVNLKISGIDKQKVGQVAAEIRAFRPPEPYKGKGVRYADEEVILKEGKKK